MPSEWGMHVRIMISDLATIGVYGIGMKRAIFKIGKHCIISTQSQPDCYEVEIDPGMDSSPRRLETTYQIQIA